MIISPTVVSAPVVVSRSTLIVLLVHIEVPLADVVLESVIKSPSVIRIGNMNHLPLTNSAVKPCVNVKLYENYLQCLLTKPLLLISNQITSSDLTTMPS